jgi:pSer/pThr/pTyr-binding forkhead associated (FHA) protein
MKRPPDIVVKLVHIQGPMKGNIQELYEERISIGRLPSYHLNFPPDLANVSRSHAEIIREGNKFKLVDHSANGTFVNGKSVKEIYLKNGDVLEFSKGGPKVSFLTEIKEIPVEHEIPLPHFPQEESKRRYQPFMEGKPRIVQPMIEKPEEVVVQKIKAPLTIQYGPTIRSFKELPVTIGRNPKCEFTLDHPAIFDQQAQIFFSQDQYWIKDLTGQRSVKVNRQPIVYQAPLKPNDEVSLSPQGPVLSFLGGGRLAEVI